MKKDKFRFPWQNLDAALGILSLVALLILAVVYSLLQITDLDIWLHLKSGEFILKNGAVFRSDPFSFTLKGQPWVDHSWLFQVIIYSIKSLFSFSGLLGLQALLISISLIFFILTVYKRRKNLFLISLFGLGLVLVSKIRLTLRPDIFSMLFFSYYCFILFKKRDTKLIYSLIPAQLAWVNLHGYHFLGIFLVLVFFIDDFIQREKRFAARLNDSGFKRLQIVFVSTIIVCLINPYTYRALIYPILAIINNFGARAFLVKIQELQPTIKLSNLFDLNSRVPFKLLVIVSFLSFLFNLKSLRVRNLFLWLVSLAFSISAVRNIAYFSLLACIFAVDNFQTHLEKNQQPYFKNENVKYVLKYLSFLILTIFITSKIINFVSKEYFSFEENRFKPIIGGIANNKYPDKAVDFILENNLPQRLFNDFSLGSYLIGKAYPARRVFIDGRTEIYGPGFLKDYLKVLSTDKIGFERIVNKYDLEGFFLCFSFSDATKDLIEFLAKDERWKIVYFDDKAVIFLKDNSENKEFIEKFSVDFKNWEVPEFEYEQFGAEKISPYPYLKRASIFKQLGLFDLQIKEADYALEIFPASHEAYNLRGEGYFRKKMYQQALSDFRAAALLQPSFAEYRNNLGSAYFELGKVDLAIEGFNQAVRLDKALVKVYYNLAIAYGRLNDTPAAIENLKMAVRLESEKAKYLEGLAQLYYRDQDIANAIKYFQKALSIEPQNSRLHVSYGVCLGAIGQHAQARDEFLKAIELDPNFAEGYLNLGNYYTVVGRYEEAMENFSKSLKLDPENRNISERIVKLRRLRKNK